MHNMRNTEPGKSSWKEARVTQGRLSLIDDPDIGGAKNTVRFLWSGDGQSKRGSPQSSDSVREKGGGKERRIPNSAVIKSLPSQQNGILLYLTPF